MVQLLVSNGARKSLGDGDKNTPLHLACAEERGEVALWLISNGANTDRRNKVRERTRQHWGRHWGQHCVLTSHDLSSI